MVGRKTRKPKRNEYGKSARPKKNNVYKNAKTLFLIGISTASLSP